MTHVLQRHLRVPALLLAIAAAALLIACTGDGDAPGDEGTPGGGTVIGGTPGDGGAIDDGDTPVDDGSDGGTGDGSTGGGNGSGSDDGDTKLIAAPIIEADVLIRESFPPQYAVVIVSELPNGCHQFEGVSMERSGTDIVITVSNRVPTDPDAVCTMIYGTHEEVVELGTDFESGIEYTVTVNDRTLTFTAQ